MTDVQRELAAVDELAAELYANGVGYSPILARALLAPAGVIARLIADAEKRAAAQALRTAAEVYSTFPQTGSLIAAGLNGMADYYLVLDKPV